LRLTEHNMDLNLTVIRYQSLPPREAPRARFGINGGTIGRTLNNDLTLPDPERWVSGQHARIHCRNGVFYLSDTSKNGTFVNHAEEPLHQGQEVELHDGDELSVGAYDIRVSLAAAEPQPVPAFDPFASDQPDSGPLDGMPSVQAVPDILDLVGPDQDGRQPPLTLEPEDEAPADLDDWLAIEPDAEEPRTPEVSPAPPDVLQAPAEPDHTPDANAFFSPPGAVPEHYDILKDRTHPATDGGTERPEAVQPAQTSGGSDEASTDQEQTGVSPTAEETPTIASKRQTAGGAAELSAFLAGLGAGELPADPAARTQFMQTAGLLLRTMIDGLMQVMMARASFKSELRLEMTTIRSKENNPFKFSVDPNDALDHLLFRPSRGFLPPQDAAREAFGDIQRHEMAIVAGLRAALRALLASMDPQKLEQRFQDRSVFDNLLPMARKAKYWDLFNETYDQVSADAAEDFLHLFGEAFSGAYEEQTSRLKQTHNHKGPPDGN